MSATTSYVKLEGSAYNVRKLMKDIDNRAAIIVRGNETLVYVGLPSSELGWLDKIAKDFSVKQLEVQSLPTYSTTPCGIFVINLKQHQGRCKQCALLRPKAHNGEAKTVVRVEGLHDLTLNGLIGLMKGKMDEAMALAQEYDNVIKAIEKIPELESQMETLTKQREDHQQALRYFTEKK